MADFTPPADTSRVIGAGISVRYSATLFGTAGNPSADSLIGSFPVAMEPAVTGWREPNHRLTSQAGNERLEDGTTITDHIVAMPARLTLQGHVSDITSPLGSDGTGNVWSLLRGLHQSEALLSVITEWAIYDEMLIRSIDTTQTNRGMVFTLELQEIIRVGVGYYEPKPRKDTGKDRGGNIDGGQRQAFTLTPAIEGQSPVLFTGPGREPAVLEEDVFARDVDGRLTVVKREDAIFDKDGSISGRKGAWLVPGYGNDTGLGAGD